MGVYMVPYSHKIVIRRYILNILYDKSVLKYLRKLTDDTQVRLEKAINGIPTGDIKLLRGYPNMYRLRVGDIRVIFKRDGNNIYVLRIGPRGDVYK